MSSTDNFFPFAQPGTGALPRVITYDLVIDEPFPGISFVPEEAGGYYQEIREVYGCLWFVTNALWNPNTLQWEQDSPCDPSLPCYAIEQCEDGSWKRNVAPPTGAINTAVVWTAVMTSNERGELTIAPTTETLQDQAALTLAPKWNAGGAAVMEAFEIDVTDTSSSADSLFEDFTVGGVSKWSVRKDGVLVVGEIPASAIIGGIVAGLVAGTGIAITPDGVNILEISLAHGDYVDLPNAQAVAGLKNFEPGVALGGFAGSGTWTDAEGNVYISSGASPETIDSQIWLAHETTAFIMSFARAVDGTVLAGVELFYNAGLTIGDTYVPTKIASIDSAGNATFNDILALGNVTIDGDLTVDGTTTLNDLIVTGTVTIPGTYLQDHLIGVGGIVISADIGDPTKTDVDGSALVETITSSDDSLTLVRTGQTVDIVVNAAVVPPIQRGFTSVTLSGSTGSTTVTIPNPYGSSSDYVAIPVLTNAFGREDATISMYVDQISGSQFTITVNGDAITGSPEFGINWITVAAS